MRTIASRHFSNSCCTCSCSEAKMFACAVGGVAGRGDGVAAPAAVDGSSPPTRVTRPSRPSVTPAQRQGRLEGERCVIADRARIDDVAWSVIDFGRRNRLLLRNQPLVTWIGTK